MKIRLLPLAVAAGFLGAGLGLSSTAQAEKTIVKTDKYEIFTDGRAGGFLSWTFGDGRPTAHQVSGIDPVLSINSPQRDSRTIRRPDTVLNRPPSAGILPTLAAPPAPPVHHRHDGPRHQRADGATTGLPAGGGARAPRGVHRNDRSDAHPVHYRLRRFLRLAQDRLPPPKASAS